MKVSTKRAHSARPAEARPDAGPPLDPLLLRRVVIEAVQPEVHAGRFPVKRTPGEDVVVSADVYADGNDALAAVLRWRRAGEEGWTEVPMTAIDNDRWAGRFTVTELGYYEYSIEAWIDQFGIWREGLSKKLGAGQDVSSELLEGGAMLRATAARIPGAAVDAAQMPRVKGAAGGLAGRKATLDRGHRAWLCEQAALLEATATPANERAPVALTERLASMMRQHADRSRATRYEHVLPVMVERERARYGAWYEMFPRSAGTDPHRSATFEEAAARLPYIAAMGFDVLYLPPIHPIGRSFRKGRNNSLNPEPWEPGSPWAIGSDEGGHTAIEPGLGTLEDFRRFSEAAARHGLEIALDLAFQASPDHPYVKTRPAWFRHRPDGTIKYAENPPKKYQDIYPFDFESEDWSALWHELKGVMEFWIARGVKIFRVDNPHTKPFGFWQWALADIRHRHPDTIFLSEAFTRPKVMRHLAKCGFSQSYSYFTWRNTAAELTEYFTELTQTSVREYLRPNLFTNTPDILHAFLQRGGPPAFQIRFVLAATLGASYGIYSGFELYENAPLQPGSEEYLDSEKYQIRPRRFEQPGGLAELITRVNGIRRAHPALQFDWGLAFHETDNPEILCYSKRSPDGADALLMVVNLDPTQMQQGWIRLPLADWNSSAGWGPQRASVHAGGPGRTIEAHDLLSDERYYWGGERAYVRLDPGVRTAHILELRLSAQIGDRQPPVNGQSAILDV